ncbi:unannotated protein [freshwater metagenome]|uniref:Unannotated protein n=1 Tax=freshwater metagenome TaxID=449393 RepID=A0A6J7SAG8_9ZZZZ
MTLGIAKNVDIQRGGSTNFIGYLIDQTNLIQEPRVDLGDVEDFYG